MTFFKKKAFRTVEPRLSREGSARVPGWGVGLISESGLLGVVVSRVRGVGAPTGGVSGSASRKVTSCGVS